MKDPHQHRQAIIWVFAFIVIITAALIALYKYTSNEFLIGILTLFGTITVASIQFRQAKEKEIEGRLFKDKSEVYVEIARTLMSLFAQKGRDQSDENHRELATKFQEIRTKLLIWGSAETITAWDQMANLHEQTDETQENFVARSTKWLGELFYAMRKDLGHKETNRAGIELALGILNEPDRSKVREIILKSKT